MMIYNIAALKTKTFPWKLHAMLNLAEREGFGGVVSWLPDGKSFKVHKPESFVKTIMPNFFQQSKYKSFQRQLNLWGFERITCGMGKGGYTRCDFFYRHNPDEICNIKRRKIKSTRPSRKKIPSEITSSTAPTKLTIESINCINLKQTKASSTISVVSHSCSDVSSISSDSDCDQSASLGSVIDDFSPMPISEITKENDCPQTGDCLDFEGRSYFFVDEEEVEATRRNATSNTLKHQIPEPTPIALCPSSIAGIELYRQFFSNDIVMLQRFGGLQAS